MLISMCQYTNDKTAKWLCSPNQDLLPTPMVTHTHTHARTHTRTHTHTYTRTHTHTHGLHRQKQFQEIRHMPKCIWYYSLTEPVYGSKL